MKKHYPRILALLLAFVMVFSLLPVTALAASVDAGSEAAFFSGLPGDSKYGVIYSCGEGYSHVFGYDINDGNAPSLEVALTSDGKAIAELPNGTAVFKFVKLDDNGTYYLTAGGKYLVIKDIDANNKEKLVFTDSVEAGAKWTIKPDQGGMTGAYNIMNAEYKYNGRDVYLEQYNGSKWCGYSYSSSGAKHFQFKFAETGADDDGRIGSLNPADPLPAEGDTVVVYNDYAKAVFGQPTGADAPKPNLTAALATRNNGAIAYEDIGDGGLIFTVSKLTDNGTDYWMYKTGDAYLGMSVNEMVDGKLVSAESLILIPEADLDSTDAQGVALREYAKWDLSEIDGGWLMHNKTAVYKGYPVYVEYFDDLFAGYSYDSGRPQIFAMNFYKVTDTYGTGYVVNPAVNIEEPRPAIGADCAVKFVIDDLNEITNVSAEYSVDGKPAVAVEAEMNNKIGTFTIPAAELEGGSVLTVRVEVTDSMNLTFRDEREIEIVDEPLILEVAPAPNSATGDEARPEISVTYANVGEGANFEMLLDNAAVAASAADGKLSYKPAADLELGKHAVSVTITRTDGKSISKNWNFFVGEGGESLYFGQVHAHTAEYSDGAGTLEQAYEHAHEVDDLDYIVITDHSNYFDTTATATTTSYYDLASLSNNPAGTVTKWEEARVTADYYNKLYDDFVCIYGYEMTWSGGPGHTNSFNTYGVVSRNNKSLNDKTGYAGMHLYNDLMVNAEKGLDVEGKEASIQRYGSYTADMKSGSLEVKRDGTAAEAKGVYATKYIPYDEAGNAVPVISQFNHPGKTFGNFDNYAGYTSKRDDVLNLIEVGNGEGKVGGSSYFPSYEEYDLCLSKGWHVAPTNNQDNHKGHFGDANTCRDVILTDDFSEIGIYRALDARHVYATEDQDLEIYYELEAAGVTYKLGDIAALDEDNQPETVKIKLTVNDPDFGDNLAKVQVIGEGGRAVWEQAVSATNFKQEFEIPNTEGYYYIKVVEADGNIAVTAPVWTKEAVPVAAELETSASVAAQGEEETVTAKLTNGSETEDVTLTAYKITAEDQVLEEKTGLSETVAASTDKVIALPFTPSPTDPSAKKTYEITAEFTFTYKGKSQKISKTIEETSYPPELMTYIGLDKGHTNFYVSGDYANNEGSFIQICAERGIICQYIEAGQMTKENLKKYKAVVLTVPRVNESTAPTVWTAEELEAIADYAANGGNLINLSKSDRYDYSKVGEDGHDTYEFASANISNLINEAVGAKTRFVRGIVVDNEMKANEAYRINFNGAELLGDHLFTTGIFASSNGQYQFYNGTGLTIEEGAEDVVSLVSPYPTSWIACYKDNFTGSAYVPNYENDTVMARKGTFSLVTAETLPGGGFLVCAGACFISNYDLKVGTAANEQYENYGLVCNILDYIKDGEFSETVTPIKDVHKGEVGQEFTIEGWVTANASDYDKDTAFFDCIYVQDETRGINCFPVSGYYYIGEQVRVHGAVTYYCGEIELNLSPEYNGSIQVISNDLNVIQPKLVKCKAAMSDSNIGNLLKVQGIITEVHRTEGVIDKIYVDDGSGEEALLFINNYIQKDYHGIDNAEVGMMCEGVGIGSRDVDEESGGADGAVGDIDPSLYIKRLRVRARDEIKCYWDPCAQFTDVNRTSWYHEGVDYVLENGIMNGISETLFNPNGTLQRAMIVTILYRMAGEPDVEGLENPFTDVKAGKYFTNAVIWANENGITTGKTATTFAPTALVTRQELATFLCRYTNLQGYDTSARADLSEFPDESSVSNFAKETMSWAVAVGLINGVKSGDVSILQPKGTATRAQIATILLRLSQTELDNKKDLVILYTNDVHCGIDNSAQSFGYAGLAALKNDLLTKHEYVGLVDAGDFIQGAAIGSLSKGAQIIPIMNKVGYEVVTLGNHEFDYGVDNILALTQQAEFDFVTANWRYTGPDGNQNAVDLPAYKIVEYGDVKIAYVGITTPESLVKSTPTYFQDENGNWIYDFCNDETGAALYEAVQTAIDAARAEGVDYVVALGHLGTDGGSAPWRSIDVIHNTTGIDVFLDGHSHSVISCDLVANKDGVDVPLTSTGTKLANVGKLTITAEGEIKTELIARADFDGVDEETQEFIDGIKAEYEALLHQVVVENLAVGLTISNPNRLDETGKPIRAVRYQETNLGDVCADAYVYASEADIAFVNGGGVRADIPAGPVTYEQIIAVHPFGNELVVIEATGQQIVDALEMSSRNTFLNADGLPDGECGGFLQVSGLVYTIYTGTPTSVVTDASGMFSSVSGDRRVGDVKVLNKATGEYEPIDLEKTYTLASHNYMLKEGGDGLNMFMKNKIIRDGGMLDNEVLINYFNSDVFNGRLQNGWYNSWDGYCARITISPDEAPAGEEPPEPNDDEVRYELTTALAKNDKVYIYYPTDGLAMTNELTGSTGKQKLVGTAVTVADGLLTPDADGKAALLTVEYPEGDEVNFYLKNSDGKYVTTGSKGNDMLLLDTPDDYSLWYLEVKDAAEGTVFIRSTNASYNGTDKNQALEYYSGFTTYGWKDTNIYTFQLYKEVKVEYGYQLKTALAKDDKVYIYYPTDGLAMTNELTGSTGKQKLVGTAVTVADGLLTPDADGKAALLTVEYPEGDEVNFYLKNSDGKYVTTGSKGNDMLLLDTPDDYSLWYLEVKDAAEGTVFIRSTNASYNGTDKNQALEYYSGFTTYGWKDTNIYTFQLYVYGEIKAEAEVITASLEAVIAEAEALDLSLYTEESAAALTEALNAARAVLENPDKTQAEVNEATAALRAAIDGLIEKTVLVPGAYNLTTTLAANDKVIVYHPASGKAMGSTLSGNKVAAVDGTVSAGVITAEGAGIYTVEFVDGSNFLLKAEDGTYLTSAETGNGMSFEASANDYSQWYLELKNASAQTVFIRSTNAAFNGNKNQALEYYNGFTTYGWKDTDAYIFQLFVYVPED